MTRAPKQTKPILGAAPSAADGGGAGIVQINVWLLGISPMAWRPALAPNTTTLRERHGVIQVAMGWEGIHLLPVLPAGRPLRFAGAVGILARSDVGDSAAAQGRARFTYEHDLNIPWRDEAALETQLEPEAGNAYPTCTGGGACPPEGCGGPAS